MSPRLGDEATIRLCSRCGQPCAEAHVCRNSAGPAPTECQASRADQRRPEQIGCYRILDEIGRGGMGVVYRAFQPSLKRIVALKVMRAGRFTDAQGLRRFVREAESAARLDHPNIVAVLDFGEFEGMQYYTMPLITGGGLDRALAAGAVDHRRAAAILERVAAAVAHAHAHGILHRDLKPANILLGADGQPMVTDFGLACELEAGSSLTGSREVLGTPQFMSPEQARGERRLDERSDVYSLGAILYQCLTGRAPFEGESAPVALALGVEPVRPRRCVASVPRDLEVVCRCAMAPERERRYPSAEAMREDLARFLSARPILARPTSPIVRVIRRLRRHPFGAAVVGGAVIAAVVAAVIAGVQLTRTRSSWQEVFADEFERVVPGPAYVAEAGGWGIVEGEMQGGGEGHAYLRLSRHCGGNVRVELEARVLPGSAKPEIAVFLDQAHAFASGYYLGLGADHACAAIDRAGTEVRLVHSLPVEQGRRYRITVLREGGRVALFADGREVISWTDPFPLSPAATGTLRIGTYDGRIAIDSLRILTRRMPELLPATSVGDRLYERGDFAGARDEYQRLARDQSGRPSGIEAELKAAVCLLHLGMADQALPTFERLSGSADRAVARIAAVEVAAALRLLGRGRDALERLRDLRRSAADPEQRHMVASELERLSSFLWNAGDDAGAFEARLLIVEGFPELPIAARSQMILARTAAGLEQRRSKLEALLASVRTPGKVRAVALQAVVTSSLLLGDEARVHGALDTLESETMFINERFAHDARFFRGLARVVIGETPGARRVADGLREAPALPELGERSALELHSAAAWRDRDLTGAAALWERAIGRTPEPAELFELGVLLLEAGDRARAAEVLAPLAAGAGFEARGAALLLGRLRPADVEADRSVPRDLRRRYLFEHARLRGDVPAALATGFLDELAPFTPAFARAIVLARAAGQPPPAE